MREDVTESTSAGILKAARQRGAVIASRFINKEINPKQAHEELTELLRRTEMVVTSSRTCRARLTTMTTPTVPNTSSVPPEPAETYELDQQANPAIG